MIAPEPPPALPLRVRRARVQDLEQIIDLAVEMVLHSVSPYRPVPPDQVRNYRRGDLQALRNHLDSPGAGVFVAEDPEGNFLGHVVVLAGHTDSSTGEPQGWIFDLSVRREWWGRGVGRTLMAAAERFVRDQGLGCLGLGVTSSNRRALRFYEELGYREERRQMVKRLDSPGERPCRPS